MKAQLLKITRKKDRVEWDRIRQENNEQGSREREREKKRKKEGEKGREKNKGERERREEGRVEESDTCIIETLPVILVGKPESILSASTYPDSTSSILPPTSNLPPIGSRDNHTKSHDGGSLPSVEGPR